MATGTLVVGLRNMAKALFWCMISSMRTCIAVWRHFNDALLRTPTGLLITTRTPHHRSRLRATESVSTADSANCPLPRPIRSPKSVPDTVFPSRRAECRDTYRALVCHGIRCSKPTTCSLISSKRTACRRKLRRTICCLDRRKFSRRLSYHQVPRARCKRLADLQRVANLSWFEDHFLHISRQHISGHVPLCLYVSSAGWDNRVRPRICGPRS